MPQQPKPPKPEKPSSIKLENVHELLSVVFDLVVVVDNNIKDVIATQDQALANQRVLLDQQMQALTNHRLILDKIGDEQVIQTNEMKTIATKVPNVSVIVEDTQPVVLHNSTRKGT